MNIRTLCFHHPYEHVREQIHHGLSDHGLLGDFGRNLFRNREQPGLVGQHQLRVFDHLHGSPVARQRYASKVSLNRVATQPGTGGPGTGWGIW